MHRRAFIVAFVILSAFLPGAATAQPATRSFPQWVTVNLDHTSQRYVDLGQITPKNVGTLAKVCEFDLNTPAWFSGGLLMVDGTIYVNTLVSTFAIDAATCARRWKYDIPLTPWVIAISNRGSAYHDNLIIRGTADGRVIALDAATGTLKWQQQAADPTRNEAFTSAPVAWDGKVFIGIVTADLGVRGRLMAFDAKSGKPLWSFNTIPVGIDPGADTWPTPQEGGVTPAGGAFWTSYSLDPATGELFGPVSNPNPDFVRTTGGLSNLYTNSVISLNMATGTLNWFCQTIAGDTHDWDLGAQPTLYRTKSGKEMLAIAGKEGFVFGIDRKSRGVAPMCEKTMVFKTAGTRVPAKLPEPPVDETLKLVCPGTMGGAEWNGTAYHPGLGILYSGMVDFCFYYSSTSYSADPGFWEAHDGGTLRPDFSKSPRGWITAMDGETGNVLWQHQTEAQVLAGLVPTKSGLLFAGDVRGNLLALDAANGQLLKRIDAGGALNHGLISYAVDGKQYIAAAVGGLTLNPAGVSGPLSVVVYGLPNGRTTAAKKLVNEARAALPLVSSWSYAPPATGIAQKTTLGAKLFSGICGGCHGFQAEGRVYPPLLRHTELANSANGYKVLKDFLRGVPPPMPVVHPGLLNDPEVEAIGSYLATLLSSPGNPQLPYSAPPGYVYTPPATNGTPQWKAIYSVLTFPRCINCHTTNYPRQRDIRYPHIYGVVRGMDDRGAPVARCQHCHGDENDPTTGVPGAPDWHIAPTTMAWESKPGIAMTGPQLCSMLKNRLLNGDRNLEGLLNHLDTRLVRWAWDPGTRWNGEPRTKPPISHAEFREAFSEWVAAGGPCPTD
ncbi:MAG: PQQ-binding-like beta-propeller repeat protein [Thermoanaerobaculia bacterium]